MAQRKRDYGSGCLLHTKGGWAIRWREWHITPDGIKRRVLRYEALGPVSRKRAAQVLAERVASASGTVTKRSHVPFRTIATEWVRSVLPMYKASTQKNHQHILDKHLLPAFGDWPISTVTRQDVQAYVARLAAAGYAPKTVDHIHDVLSAVLRTAVSWGHLADNPARGVRLPPLRTVRPKWALTTTQAATLLEALPALPRAMVALALLTGLRRGELFALRWGAVDDAARVLEVREAVYEGVFGTPKTAASRRRVPLSDAAVQVLRAWKPHARDTAPEALVFGTRSGKPIAPNNVLRRWVFPACTATGVPRTTWLTCRRTYASWAHDRGVAAKIVAQVMGHTKVDTTLNVYTQVLDASVRGATEAIGTELFNLVQSRETTSALIH